MSQALPLRYEVDRDFPTAWVRLAGSLDSRVAATLRNVMLDCLSHQPATLIVDIEQLSNLEPAGAEALVDIGRRNAQWPGACLLVFPATSDLIGPLRRAGVGRYAQLCATRADAVAVAETQQTPLRVEHQLVPSVEAAAVARSLVARTCQRWGIPHAISTAQVVASELVNNAVLHAGEVLDFTLVHRDDTLALSVHDRNPRPPRRWEPVRDADEVGRGLLLLDAFALRWGSLPTGRGKTVWATIAA